MKRIVELSVIIMTDENTPAANVCETIGNAVEEAVSSDETLILDVSILSDREVDDSDADEMIL